MGLVLVIEGLGCFSFYWGKLRGTFKFFLKQEESGWNPTPSGLVEATQPKKVPGPLVICSGARMRQLNFLPLVSLPFSQIFESDGAIGWFFFVYV